MENQPIDVALQKASWLVNQEFKLKRVNEARIRGILNYTAHQEPALLNSFYGDDLARILAADDDALLTAYVHGRQQQHEDIDKNWAKIDQILQPANLPDGRWPSPDAFFQSLMQQVSINVLRERGGLKADLQTVNGPPGTGKTTLLKDVFADIVVEQAKAMAKLDKPSDGFKKIDQIVLYQKIKFNCFELIPELRGFGVVVSSNNNSAVANIAKDFPNKKEIQQFPDNHQNDYLDQLAKIDYFTDIAKSALQSEQAWGLFAVQMGSQKNQQRVVDAVIKSAKGTTPFKVAAAQGRSADTWQAARKNFQQRLAAVQTAKKDVVAKIKRVRAYDPAKLADLESQLAATTPQPLLNEIQQLRAGVAEQQRAVNAIPKRGGLLFWLPSQRQRARLASQLAELHTQIAAKQTALANLQQQIDGLKQRIAIIKQERQRIEALKRELNADQTYGATLDYWQQTSADKLQIQVPYNSKRLQAARAELFIAAMRLRKQFICEAEKPVSNAWHVFKERKSLLFPQQAHVLTAAFQIMQLLVPVMSTTLASVQSMFKQFGANTLDNVFVDEAGQATPSSVAGLIWRARHFTAVGDPAQIEPVVTTGEAALRMIAQAYDVDAKYTIPTSSAQQLADNASVYGTVRQDGSWIGMPLWVHRRCASPMFEIANEISYENRMVQGKPTKKGDRMTSQWLDSKGTTSQRQFVPVHAKVVADQIKTLLESGVELDDIFVISPFRAVVAGMKRALRGQSGGGDGAKWVDSHIGTVHTFQGKEADVVFFVIGTDATSDGSANWAFQKPNLLNVAATRAKKAFYVVGDRKRIGPKNYITVADRLLG